MSIKVEQVTKIYGKQKALDNVSLNIGKGEIVGLLGPNGAGKSTLMKIITCYIPPTSGEAFVNDFSCKTQSIDVRKIIGYLPESNPLYYDMFVKEFLLFIAGIHKLNNKKERVDKIIEITGLTLEMHKRIGALSKGYKQRVGLAQALIHDPEVLIMDEPTSGLDPNQIIEIRQLIKEIGKEKTVLLSTHIMQEVEAICNRVVIIDKGKIIADDKSENLSSLFVGNNVFSVEFDKNVSKNMITNISGVKSAENLPNTNIWKLEAKANTDLRSEIFDFAVKNNIKVLSLSKKNILLKNFFNNLQNKLLF